jgi:hypothetical protein
MSYADPWDECTRLEDLLETDLFRQAERSSLHAAAEAFCTGKCRVNDGCRLADAIDSRADCPLWIYVRTTAPGP